MNSPAREPGVEDRLQKLTERVASEIVGLERKNRVLRRLTGALAVAVFLVCGMLTVLWIEPSLIPEGSADERVVRAGRFVLVDAQGRDRGEWSVGEDGRARLELDDRDGQPRMSLTVLSSGFPGISFSNEDGDRRVVLGILPDETSTLVFADRHGTPRAVMGVSAAGSANLVFGDGSGKSRVGMGLEASGAPTVLLPDSAGETPENAVGGLDDGGP